MRFSTFVLSVIFLSVIASNAGIENDRIVGLWRVDVAKTLAIMEPDVKARYDTLSPDVQARVAKAMNDREFVFSATGEISVAWRSPKGQRISTGRWSVDSSYRQLQIAIDGRTVVYDIESPSKDVMMWKGKVKRGFFSNLYLRKG